MGVPRFEAASVTCSPGVLLCNPLPRLLGCIWRAPSRILEFVTRFSGRVCVTYVAFRMSSARATDDQTIIFNLLCLNSSLFSTDQRAPFAFYADVRVISGEIISLAAKPRG